MLGAIPYLGRDVLFAVCLVGVLFTSLKTADEIIKQTKSLFL